MEFKMMDESYEVSYPTEKKNNGMMVKFISCCKSIGICFLFFELLKSQCLAAELSYDQFVDGGLVAQPPTLMEQVIETIFPIGVGTIIVIAIITFIVIFVKRNRTSKENSEKNEAEDIDNLE